MSWFLDLFTDDPDKGILYKETKAALAEYLDSKIKAKGVLEMVDGPILKIAVNEIDDWLLDRIPIEHEETVNNIVMDITEEDFDSFTEKLADLVALIVPTPIIDGTEMESDIFHTALLVPFSYLFKDFQALADKLTEMNIPIPEFIQKKLPPQGGN